MIGADARFMSGGCDIEDVKIILNMRMGDWNAGRRGPDCAAVAIKCEQEAVPNEVRDREERAVELWDV
jgi:hypothetical protein